MSAKDVDPQLTRRQAENCRAAIKVSTLIRRLQDNAAGTLECEKCGEPMVIRSGRRGKFMACSAYPKCKNTISVDENLKPVRPQTTDIACEKCSSPMVVKYGRRGAFLACSAYPKCRNAKPLPDDMKEQPEETDKPCPECGKKLLIRSGRRGKFMACTGYPQCKYTESVKEA